jgi:choline dehydrogenase-like flavoprotein
MPVPTESTTFTKDVLGRYLCNTLGEAQASGPFNVIVLGAGAFGPALAVHLFNIDAAKRHRILVLDGGKFVLPEHIQNLPPMLAGTGGIGVPSSTTIEALRQAGQDRAPRDEVWGLPWFTNDPNGFPGLAYCVGGRSVFWGGWSPRPVATELTQWPADVVADLTATQWPATQQLIGSDTDNDFVFGPLHQAMKNRLLAGLQANQVPDALPAGAADIEAPLAVQSASPRAGYFPPNKFSSLPGLMRAARRAAQESGGNDANKRLMVVTDCHVSGLTLAGNRVSVVQTNQGNIQVPANGVVVTALGTVESTRLALNSFPNAQGLIGKNLMAHLRTNLTIRLPRAGFPGVPPDAQTSALFVKGRHTQGQPADAGHFHVQITASGVTGAQADNSEIELFQKIPDIDFLQAHAMANDNFVIVTLRGIGEMVGDKQSVAVRGITPHPELDFGTPRAFVRIGTTQAENGVNGLWNAMDQALLQLAQVLAGGGQVEYEVPPNSQQFQANPPASLQAMRDVLGSTHHESGTLWMGTDPATSVTDGFGAFHEVANAYVAGPALFPQMGSPNPMLTGVALARRTAERINAL